ncbi:MAG: universal stress protein [Candidatus Binatia bacterium]
MLEEQRKSAQQQLAALQRRQARRGTNVRPLLRSGVAYQGILEAAAAEKASLIVMATHGRIGWAHAFLGRVAERVVRTAPCPVLTIGPQRREAVKRACAIRAERRRWPESRAPDSARVRSPSPALAEQPSRGSRSESLWRERRNPDERGGIFTPGSDDTGLRRTAGGIAHFRCASGAP